MLLLSGIVLKLASPEHGLPQARFTEAWRKTTLKHLLGTQVRLSQLHTFVLPLVRDIYPCEHNLHSRKSDSEVMVHQIVFAHALPAKH